jgi:hypothetical protein
MIENVVEYNLMNFTFCLSTFNFNFFYFGFLNYLYHVFVTINILGLKPDTMTTSFSKNPIELELLSPRSKQ